MPGKSRTVRPPEFDVLVASTRDETARLQPGVHSLSICESSKTSNGKNELALLPPVGNVLGVNQFFRANYRNLNLIIRSTSKGHERLGNFIIWTHPWIG